MDKISKILKKVIISISVLLYVICLGLVTYFFYAKEHFLVWQVLIILTILILIPASVVYVFLQARKNISSDDLKREQEILDEVVDIRKGKIINPKSNLGKWYLGAFVVIFLFPVIANFINRFGISPQTESNILLFIGYVIIIAFIVGMVYTNKSKKN
jgi:hypothetical protein